MRRPRTKNLPGYLMIAPSYTIYSVFVLIPLAFTILLSGTNYDLFRTFDFVGLRNFRMLLEDDVFHTAFQNTAVYAFFTIVLQMGLGLFLAQVVNGRGVVGAKLWKVFVYLPYTISMVAASMMWIWLYEPTYGIINRFLGAVGLPTLGWLNDINLALPSLVVVTVWKLVGYNMIVYLAGLQQIPGDLYEVADIDGASNARKFFSITLPLLRPTTFFLFVIACIGTFNVFDQVQVMTGGGPVNATTTVVHQVYLRAFTNYQMGYAAAMTVILMVLTLSLTMINFKFGRGAWADVD